MDFVPIPGRIYVFDKHSLLFLVSGHGEFQVDFRNYNFPSGKAIFLSPGQYFRLVSGDFKIVRIDFPDQTVSQRENSRFLFKHLVSLGYVDMTGGEQLITGRVHQMDVSVTSVELLTNAIENWIALNPFKASSEDVNLLFDLKDIIDKRFKEPVSIGEISKELKQKEYRILRLSKDKLNHTINKLSHNKLLLESMRQIVFTDMSTKEIAYDLGFKDPPYFNRFFKLHTEKTPQEFREGYTFDARDTFITDLHRLIDDNYTKYHFAEYYARQLNMSVKALSRKINDKLGSSLTTLIRDRKLREAERLLRDGIPVNVIALELGFAEPNHLSSFFKKHTGKSPSEFNSRF